MAAPEDTNLENEMLDYENEAPVEADEQEAAAEPVDVEADPPAAVEAQDGEGADDAQPEVEMAEEVEVADEAAEYAAPTDVQEPDEPADAAGAKEDDDAGMGEEDAGMAKEAAENDEDTGNAGEDDGKGTAAQAEDHPHRPDDEHADGQDPMAMPPHGTEVYVGGFAREATDEQVKEFCAQAGEIFAFKVLKDPNSEKLNRGYAFVTYKQKEQADEAIRTLNGSEMKDLPGKKIKVMLSQVKNRLFLGRLPKDINDAQLMEQVSAEVKGVTKIELLMEKESNMNRGFAFVDFYNHACAEAARKKMGSTAFRLNGQSITVMWADPKKSESEAEQVRAIYVGSLPESVTEAKLKDLFAAFGEIEQIALPKSKDDPSKFRDYGFVHYKDRTSAQRALTAFEAEKPEIDGKEVMVKMAKPQIQSTTRPGGPGDYGRDYGRGPSSGGYGGGYGGGQGYGGPRQSSYSSQGSYGRPQSNGRGPPPSSRAPLRSGPRSPGRSAPPPARGSSRAGGYGGGYGGGYDDQYDEQYGDDYSYGGGYGSGYGGYSSGGTMMVPMMLANGQVGYMLSGATTAVRRGSGGYGGAASSRSSYGYGDGEAGGYSSGGGYGGGASSSGGYGGSGGGYGGSGRGSGRGGRSAPPAPAPRSTGGGYGGSSGGGYGGSSSTGGGYGAARQGSYSGASARYRPY